MGAIDHRSAPARPVVHRTPTEDVLSCGHSVEPHEVRRFQPRADAGFRRCVKCRTGVLPEWACLPGPLKDIRRI